jgi:copper chaperone
VDRGRFREHILVSKETQVNTKQTTALTVEGMSCQHCVHAVKGAVGGLKGVDAVDVSLEKKLVTVGYDPALVGLPAIRTAIEDQGYTVK